MKDGNKNIIVLLVLLAISITIHHVWFLSFRFLTHGDWGFLFMEQMCNFSLLPYAWNSTYLLGSSETLPSLYPTLLAYSTIAHLGFDFAVSERIIFMWPVAVLPFLCAFVLVKRLTASYVGGFVGALVYSLNSYYCVVTTGHLTVAVTYSLAPLVLHCFMISLEKASFRHSVITGLLLCVCGIYEFRVAYIITWIIFFYWVFYVINQGKWRACIKYSPFIVVPCAILLSFNAYWLLGMFAGGGMKGMAFLHRGLFGEGYLNLPRALTCFHPFWSTAGQTPFKIQPIPIYSWLIPVLAFGALVFKEKNRNILFFALLALIGVMLTKQSAPPFASLYPWLYEHFPGFNAFREASKFYLIIALAYCVLIGYTTSKSYEYLKPKYKALAYATVCLISVLFLWNAKPFITGEIGTIFVPKDVPGEYVTLKDFLYGDKRFYRTLWLPRDSRYGFFSQTHPKVGIIDLIEGPWRELSGSGSYIRRVERVLTSGYARFQMDACKIKYVILPTDPENDVYIHYAASRYRYKEILESLPWLQRVDVGTGELLVYEYVYYND